MSSEPQRVLPVGAPESSPASGTAPGNQGAPSGRGRGGRGGHNRGRGRGRNKQSRDSPPQPSEAPLPSQPASSLSPSAAPFTPSAALPIPSPVIPVESSSGQRGGKRGKGRRGGGGRGGGRTNIDDTVESEELAPLPNQRPGPGQNHRNVYKNSTRHKGRIDEEVANVGARPSQLKKKAANLTSFGNEDLPSSSIPDEEPETKEINPTEGITKKQMRLSKLSQGQSDLSQRLISQLLSGTYECMVCVDRLGRKAAIWNCPSCFHLFHIACIKKWRKSSLADEKEWKCPACRHSYTELPVSSCFCFKSFSPDFNPFFIPHSCGEVCNKKRNNNCPHACLLLCHPGPCPDCTAMGPIKQCHCGRSSYQKLCGEEDQGKSCGLPCAKTLKCKKHSCKENCHPGECKPCPVKISSKCYCGSQQSEVSCGEEEEEDASHGPSDIRLYSCGSSCMRKLPCGHLCEEKCHPSSSKKTPTCPPCPLLPETIKTCACGKKSASLFPPRLSCQDPLPLCGSPCDRLKSCGRHRCTSPCHEGPCSSSCSEEVELQCRCGNPRGSVRMKCEEAQALKTPITCSRVCRTLRDCGKHQCGVKCCPVTKNPEDPDGFHVCRTTCGKTLNCSKHTCSHPCHRGLCPPCLEASFEDRPCPCGKTIHYAPIACGSEPTVCSFPCIKAPPCGHPPVSHRCHWQGPCPPCPTLTTRRCSCGKMTMKAIPCSQTDVLCGRVCGRRMTCEEHSCSRKCHTGPCELPLLPNESLPPSSSSDAKPSCGQRCSRRLPSCRHHCIFQCHPGLNCPDNLKCSQKLRIFCKCGRLNDLVSCPGLEEKFLECDELCLKQIRQQKLADALGISSSSAPPSYSDLLLNMYRATPIFIENLEASFAQLIKSPQLKMQLPIMDAIQRKTVHELSRYYLLDTESLGREPNRYIQLTKKQGTRIPMMLLSDYATLHDSVVLPGELPPSLKKPTGPRPTPSALHTLHIYELNPRISTIHLTDFLRPFEGNYTIQWIDDENALVIFSDSATMYKALNALSGGLFKIKQYQDAHPRPAPSAGGSIVLGNGLPSSPPPHPPPPTSEEYRTVSSRRAGTPSLLQKDTQDFSSPNPFEILEEASKTSSSSSSSDRELWRQFEEATSSAAEEERKKEEEGKREEKEEKEEKGEKDQPVSWEDLAEKVLNNDE